MIYIQNIRLKIESLTILIYSGPFFELKSFNKMTSMVSNPIHQQAQSPCSELKKLSFIYFAILTKFLFFW